MNSTSLTAARMVCVRSRNRCQMNPRRDHRMHVRERRFNVVDGVDDIGAGLLEDYQHHRSLVAMQRAERHVLRSVDRPADILDADRRAVAVGHDHVVIRPSLRQLIVVDDGEALHLAEHRALGGIGRGAQQRGAHVFQRQAAGRQLGRVDLHADRRPLLAADSDERDAGNLRNLRSDDVLGEIVDLRQWKRIGSRRHNQDRGIRRVRLLIGRRIGKIFRQVRTGGRDCRLNVAAPHRRYCG